MQLLRQDMASLFVSEGQDWSSKAIIAALDRRGVSLSDLENELGVGKMRSAMFSTVSADVMKKLSQKKSEYHLR